LKWQRLYIADFGQQKNVELGVKEERQLGS
jgi:hypothetical protein